MEENSELSEHSENKSGSKEGSLELEIEMKYSIERDSRALSIQGLDIFKEGMRELVNEFNVKNINIRVHDDYQYLLPRALKKGVARVAHRERRAKKKHNKRGFSEVRRQMFGEKRRRMMEAGYEERGYEQEDWGLQEQYFHKFAPMSRLPVQRIFSAENFQVPVLQNEDMNESRNRNMVNLVHHLAHQRLLDYPTANLMTESFIKFLAKTLLSLHDNFVEKKTIIRPRHIGCNCYPCTEFLVLHNILKNNQMSKLIKKYFEYSNLNLIYTNFQEKPKLFSIQHDPQTNLNIFFYKLDQRYYSLKGKRSCILLQATRAIEAEDSLQLAFTLDNQCIYPHIIIPIQNQRKER